jgi:aryl-alcohol dehydrogenase-like predicted oxidoreductase
LTEKDKTFGNDTRLGNTDSQTSKWLKQQLVDGQGLNNLEEKEPAKVQQKLEDLKAIADKLGCTLAQLALAWVIFPI